MMSDSTMVPNSTLRLPLTEQIRDQLLADIRSRKLPPGAKLLPVRSYADEWGCGVSTVVRALELLRSDGMIFVRHGRGAFVAPQADTAAKTSVSFCLHPTYLTRDNWLAFERTRGIIEAAAQRGVDLHPVTAAAEFCPPTDESPCGVLLFDPYYESDGFGEVARSAEERGWPVCMVVGYEGAPFPYVHGNRALGFERATEYLLHLGHRRIAFLNIQPDGTEIQEYRRTENREGYLHALARKGVTAEPALYVEAPQVQAAEGPAHTWEAVDLLLSRVPRPTAIVCDNDERALMALKILHSRGLRVPGDISVVGYDNRPECERCTPTLTSVNTHLRAQGAEALNYVVSRLRGRTSSLSSVTPSLVGRASSGPPPVESESMGRSPR